MKLKENKKVWTIGHSTKSLEDFLEMLHSFQIKQIIDVRRFPTSRKIRQFDKEALENSLAEKKWNISIWNCWEEEESQNMIRKTTSGDILLLEVMQIIWKPQLLKMVLKK